MRFHIGWLLSVLFIMSLQFSWPAGAQNNERPLLWFSGANGLGYVNRAGTESQAKLVRGSEANLDFIERNSGKRKSKGVHIAPAATIALPVEGVNPQEGTLSFWFRPNWAPFNRRASVIIELDLPSVGRLNFRKGYPHVPDNCYLNFDGQDKSSWGYRSFGPHNLFTGREWRHYAIRWSQKRGEIQFVVDGESSGGRTARYKPNANATGPASGQILLPGEALGAFSDVKLFDSFLETPDLIKAAGLAQVASYLQDQRPPAGTPQSAPQPMSYVDPATGQMVDAVIPAGASGAGDVYDTEAVKDIPATPHTAWAKPLAGGAVKVLFVMPSGNMYSNSLVREGVELWQRLDTKCVITNKYDPAVMNRDYDVIVVSHQGMVNNDWVGWTALDSRVREWILERVSSGRSGLVYAFTLHLDDALNKLFAGQQKLSAEVVTRGFPTTAMHRANVANPYEKLYDHDESFYQDPAELSSKIVEVFRGDKVRAVKLNYAAGPGWPARSALTPDTAINCGATLAHYDYWMGLMARAILYAANREPKSKIVSADVSRSTWKVQVGNAGTGATLQYRARDIWGEEYATGKMALKTSVAVSISGRRLAPRTVVDFFLRDSKGQLLDWYSAAVPPAQQAKIADIRLDKSFYERQDTIKGVIGLTSKTSALHRIEIYLRDYEGRQLTRKTFRVDGGKPDVSFAMPIPASSRSLVLRLDAQLYDSNGIVDRHNIECPVPNQTVEEFPFIMYGATHNRASDVLRRQLFRDRFGVNTMVHRGAHTYGVLASENLGNVKYTTHLGYPDTEEKLNSWMEDWNQFFPKHLDADPKQIVRYRPLFYSLGEEHLMGVEGSKNPKVNALFREHLQKKYANLEALNAAWGTTYTAWEQVTTATPEIVDMMKLQFDVLRFESRRFFEHLFADKHAFLAQYFYKLDPHARVGIHTGWDLWMGRGYDYWLLSRAMDSMIGYDSSQGFSQNAYIRSFFQNYYGAFSHYFIGSHEDVRWNPWAMLSNGAKALGWYEMGGDPWAATTPDLHLSSDWQVAAPEYTAAAQIGDLLTRCDYEQDEVAIHYSQDSFQAGVGSAISWIHLSYINLLFDGGVPFRFVSYQQVAEGDLAKRKPALLILPHSISLSQAETAAIRAYVQNGGTVWADVEPGTHNDAGRRLPQSQLTDLFANLKELKLPDGGTLKVGTFGQGKVVLGDIGNYSYARNIGDYQKEQDMLDSVVQLAGVRRVARITNAADGKVPNAIWAGGYRHGRQRYLTVVKDYQIVDKSTVDVAVDVGAAGHIYEMRSGEYLGRASKVRTSIRPTIGKVFSILPYRVKKIETGPIKAVRRGQDLTVPLQLVTEGKVQAADLHVLRVHVTGGDGKEVVPLRRVVELKGGKGEIRLPLAYNDKAGQWTVRYKDIATGIGGEVRFNLPPLRGE